MWNYLFGEVSVEMPTNDGFTYLLPMNDYINL